MELTTTYLNRIGADFEVIINPCGIQMGNKYSDGEWIDPFSEGVRNVINTCISSLGFGWLARGNFSWDTSGNLYGPDTTYTDFDTQEEETIKAWELLANGSMKFNNGCGIELNGDPGSENQVYSYLCDVGLMATNPMTNECSWFSNDGVYLGSEQTYANARQHSTIVIGSSGITYNGDKSISWSDLFSFLESNGATVTATSTPIVT